MAKEPAVFFRRKVYVGQLRHKDAINAAFAGMSQHQIRRAFDRIADGKEDIVFGWVEKGSAVFEPQEEYQAARKIMYGFD